MTTSPSNLRAYLVAIQFPTIGTSDGSGTEHLLRDYSDKNIIIFMDEWVDRYVDITAPGFFKITHEGKLVLKRTWHEYV